MSGKFFLDTNIFVYAFMPGASAKKLRAEELIMKALGDLSGVISYQVIQEFFNVALRPPNLMPVHAAQEYLGTVFRPLLQVQSSVNLYSEALRIKGRYQLNLYDSLMMAAALESGCRTLYTEDMQHGMQIGSVKITNPFLRHG